MALNDRTTVPSVGQSLCDVQFTRLLSPSITALAAGRGREEEGRLGPSNVATVTKGTEPPWSGLVHRRSIHSFIHYYTEAAPPVF